MIITVHGTYQLRSTNTRDNCISSNITLQLPLTLVTESVNWITQLLPDLMKMSSHFGFHHFVQLHVEVFFLFVYSADC